MLRRLIHGKHRRVASGGTTRRKRPRPMLQRAFALRPVVAATPGGPIND
jgi:hypothetical protein